jgi:hypothetical protein
MSNAFTPEPKWWPDDGGTRRFPIYDHMDRPPRLVRKVGWVNCLGRFGGKPHRFISPDVARVRICTACKNTETATHRQHVLADYSL